MPKPLFLVIGDNQDYISLAQKTDALTQCPFEIVASCRAAEPFLESDNTVILFCFTEYNSEVFSFIEEKKLLESCSMKLIFFSTGIVNTNLDKCMRSGGFFHFRPPMSLDAINDVLKETFENHSNTLNQKHIKSPIDQFGLLCGNSEAMLEVFKQINKVADSDISVLLVGESGTGKELAAQTIHLLSLRCENPFLPVNCGAIPKDLIESELFGYRKGSFTGANKDFTGYFERVKDGSLFLDEITEMPIDLQVKLLRALETKKFFPLGSEQEQEIDARFISATNQDPEQAINTTLREDIYYRLAQFIIYLPPLRDRTEDILPLTEHFLAKRIQQTNRPKVLSDSAKELLKRYSWPGNVRELKHRLEQAYILADDIITPDNFPDILNRNEESASSITSGITIEKAEETLIKNTLIENNYNRKKTAEQLGISEKTLYNKISKYELLDDATEPKAEKNKSE